MPKLKLYKVGTNGRIALGGYATEEFYTVEKEDDGTIVLSPVEVTTTGTKREVEDDDPFTA
jgi:hypothetical protein